MKTLKNKIVALILLIIGWLSTKIDGDGTILVFFTMMSIPLLISKENWIDF